MAPGSLAAVIALGALIALGGVFLIGWRAGAKPRRGAPPAPPDCATPSAANESASGALTPVLRAAEQARLGRYLLDRQLGRGAMGTVYLARDEAAGRPVALKTMALAREFEGQELAEARTRFFREAEMAGRLRHPEIVTIFDAGEDKGLAFIAMEYVQGHDLLRHTLPGRLLPVETVLATLERVAHALAYAHTQGVIHRDVKPANVMIDPLNDTVKVTDFGIARITDACRTRTGLVLGTPSFMSPEQMAGRRVDGRTDLYSLGVMLYQLLTGALPHPSESMSQLMYQIANEPAPDIRLLRPELPETLANVVALALEKRPEMRYSRRHRDGHRPARRGRPARRAACAGGGPVGTGRHPPSASDSFEATVEFSRSRSEAQCRALIKSSHACIRLVHDTRVLQRHRHRPGAQQQRGFGGGGRVDRTGRARRRHGRLQRRRGRQRHGHLVHQGPNSGAGSPRPPRAPPTPMCAARWTSASTTPTARSSTPPIPTRNTPAWARRWSSACSAMRVC